MAADQDGCRSGKLSIRVAADQFKDNCVTCRFNLGSEGIAHFLGICMRMKVNVIIAW